MEWNYDGIHQSTTNWISNGHHRMQGLLFPCAQRKDITHTIFSLLYSFINHILFHSLSSKLTPRVQPTWYPAGSEQSWNLKIERIGLYQTNQDNKGHAAEFLWNNITISAGGNRVEENVPLFCLHWGQKGKYRAWELASV